MRFPCSPPPFSDLLRRTDLAAVAQRAIGAAPGGRYRHWDGVRMLSPPPGMTTEEWWVGIKLARRGMLRPMPLLDAAGVPFRVSVPDVALGKLHRIDRLASEATVPDALTAPETRERLRLGALREEALRSSQLEGAQVTRTVAKEMLRSGRLPRNRDERMIHNNYQALLRVPDLARHPLTPDLVMRLHRVLTEDTLLDPGSAGRLRRAGDTLGAEDNRGGLLHTPPPAGELPARLRALCDFANDRSEERFLPPAVRAALLHFWVAHDHPFVAANGRLARALCCWAMLTAGSRFFEFLPVSRELHASPGDYNRAFLLAQTDENDATYFVLHQLAAVLRAMDSLQEHVERKAREAREARSLVRRSGILRQALNHRQLALVNHGLRNPQTTFTFEAHKRTHQVTYQTARTDLLSLAEHGLLEKVKIGRRFHFEVPEDFRDRLDHVGR